MNKNSYFHRKALEISKTCFLNSFFREWQGEKVARVNPLNPTLHYSLNEKEELLFPLERSSAVGRHSYGPSIFLKSEKHFSELTFQSMVDILSESLARRFGTSLLQLRSFKSRVKNSLKNIEHSLVKRHGAIRQFYKKPSGFIDSEQMLIVGHNFHPNPKSRDEFSEKDLENYAPEFGGSFSLQWFWADPDILIQKKAQSFSKDWVFDLVKFEIPISEQEPYLKKGFVPVPMHPWQSSQLVNNSLIQKYLAEGKLVMARPSTQKEWKATSSLRSVYRENSPYMLKFSMSLKLTNSVRHLLAHEVDRGLQLFDVLSTSKGQEFLERHPCFQVLGEPSYMCFKTPEGSPLSESIVVCRENPFQGDLGRNKFLLATLAQDAPLGGANLIVRMLRSRKNEDLSLAIKQWFRRYMDVVLGPLIDAQSNYGILLGAHQQNLILELEEAYPKKSYFRDCQGTGYSDLGYSLFSANVSSMTKENGNILDSQRTNALFCYYLILNSTFNVISALSRDGLVNEENLLMDLRRYLELLYVKGVRDSSCLKYLLFDTHLMHKGNFLCSFKNINENTTADPLVIYSRILNNIPSLSPFPNAKEEQQYA